jgi:hypothetical protein
MTIMPTAQDVRAIVHRLFTELGLRPHRDNVLETFVFDNRKFVARSYRLRGHLVMWMVEAGILVCYDPRGHILRTINLFERIEPIAVAA